MNWFPAAIAWAPCRSFTVTAVGRDVVVPSPSCPVVFCPKHATRPAPSIAHVCATPAATRCETGAGGFGRPDGRESARPAARALVPSPGLPPLAGGAAGRPQQHGPPHRHFRLRARRELGEDTAEVLRTVLGMTQDEIATLTRSGVVKEFE